MSASTNHRAHVLVMNDTQEVLDVVQMLLEEEGYRVSTSLHTLDIARIRDLAPDVIVLDLVFEHQLKGWHFLTLVRLDRRLCRVPLILCTAAVKTVEPMRANLAAQQVRIVYKPFDIETLLAEIDAAALGLLVPLAVDVPMAD